MLGNITQGIYNVTSKVESNALLNRGLTEAGGVQIPFSIMANNRDECIERTSRTVAIILASLVIPCVIVPKLNRYVLKSFKLISNSADEKVHILQVSKEFLKNNAEEMVTGIRNTAKELSKKEKFRNLPEVFEQLLKEYKGKEEELRLKLIDAHKKIFATDFLISGLLCSSIPWVFNYITEKRTGRKGYVGEFKMADKNYTDEMNKKHEQKKYIKMAINAALIAIPALFIPKLAAKAMKTSSEKLGFFMKKLKQNAKIFDYKDAVFLSRAALCSMLVFGDAPAYVLAARDKHEAKLQATAMTYVFSMMFAGDLILNNLFGQLSDKYRGTTLMNRKGFENAGLFRRLLMPVHSLKDLKKLPDISLRTKRTALGMYWLNFGIILATLGFGMPLVLNAVLRKDVKEGQKNMFSTSKQNIKMEEFFKLVRTKSTSVNSQ
jgi:hypothetical protein